ncbi:voltage-dependent anion channel-domain-containing protein [Parachaetomium inaequale]|uniref:Voltage-dependent anion channel-domain-containing protein n=1 Tax=Parachaetomium inaequale TaxID=2588326 RepID=A0AAN6PBG0_9PEZI|nr:voltage-dependent anion channel-domain-containing protein [Parachaetomium inaequale]
MNQTQPPKGRSWRDDIPLTHIPAVETANRHSTKVQDFFGIPPSASPRDNSPTDGSRTEVNDDLPSEPRSSITYRDITLHNISSKIKEQYPTIKMHTRRTRRNLSILIQSCTPIWFTPPTTLALLALALRLLPLAKISFPSLIPLSTALYLASFALFIPTSTLLLLRFILYPRETYREAVHERDSSGLELGYLSAWPTGWILLVAFGGFAVSEGKVGTSSAADGLATAVYVCWWLGAVAVGVVVMFVLGCLLSSRSRSTHRTGGGRFAPLVGWLVCMQAVGTVAFVGGLLAWLRRPGNDSDSGEGLFSAATAAPVVVLSFCATGAAWFLANLDYGVLMHELVLVVGWPPPEHSATVFSMVGPLGQCASALLVLAAAARRGDGGVSMGGDLVKSRMVAGLAAMAPLETVCVLLALLMGGIAVVWLLLGIITIFYRLSRGELAWNPSWNGIVSPVATLAVLSILLAMELDSAFFRIAACVIIICCILMVVVNLGFTVRLAVTSRSKQDVSGTGSQPEA